MKSGILNLKLKKNKSQDIVLILGDMLDLGKDSLSLHSELGKYINGLNFIDSVYCVGEQSSYVIKNIDNQKKLICNCSKILILSSIF